MRLKRILLILLFAALAYYGSHYFLGNEGGNYLTVGSISSNLGTQMKSSYHSFEGTKYRTIVLIEGNILHLEAEIETTRGTLTFSLIDPNGDAVYAVSNPETSIDEDFEIALTGEYRLQVEGEHEGSYKLDWEVRQRFEFVERIFKKIFTKEESSGRIGKTIENMNAMIKTSTHGALL